jgi:hypothetical protein
MAPTRKALTGFRKASKNGTGTSCHARLVDIERKYREVRNTIVERFDNWLIVVIAGVAAGLVVGGVYRSIVALE